jgi:hypothetical protein
MDIFIMAAILPRTLKRLAKKDFVDVYPMVWKDFRKKGYVTAWAEDCPHIGTFTYRMVGFKDSPTDHYMRPFYVTAEHEYESLWSAITYYIISI